MGLITYIQYKRLVTIFLFVSTLTFSSMYMQHKLKAIKAKMGSADDEFTPLSQLTLGTNKCRVQVRISRLWESFNPKNDILFGLDSLLIDDQVIHSLPYVQHQMADRIAYWLLMLNCHPLSFQCIDSSSYFALVG